MLGMVKNGKGDKNMPKFSILHLTLYGLKIKCNLEKIKLFSIHTNGWYKSSLQISTATKSVPNEEK